MCYAVAMSAPVITFTRDDLARVAAALNLHVDIFPCLITYRRAIEDLSYFTLETVINTIVQSAVGSAAPLAEALDALDDSGTLTRRVFGASQVGRFECCVVFRDRFRHTTRLYWPCVTLAHRLTIDESRGLPIFQVWKSCVNWTGHVVFRTGDEAPLVMVPDTRNPVQFLIHPNHADRIRGRWRSDSEILNTPVVFV